MITLRTYGNMTMKPLSSLIAHVVVLMAFWLALLGAVQAQVETVLHTFQDGTVTNDGNLPQAALILGTNGNFYGTTLDGGANGFGCVFEMTPLGSTSILYTFVNPQFGITNPNGLVQGIDGNFYGTTQNGPMGGGAVFKITPQGNLTILHLFGDGTVPNDGQTPEAALVQGSDGNFYGTTSSGGTLADGTVFKITPEGVETVLHNFGGTAYNVDGSSTTDGVNPTVGLVQGSDGNFYGAAGGGTASNGVIFRMTPQGTVTILHAFKDGSVTNDGTLAQASLIQGTDGDFYGTTASGGAVDGAYSGTVFKITPGGTLTILHSFGDQSVLNDGDNNIGDPQGGLIQGYDGNMYGSTPQGGSNGQGTLFEITPQGAYTILYSFGASGSGDGSNPQATLTRGPNGLLYGVTSTGGTNAGTVFSLAPALPMLTSLSTATGAVSVPFSYQVTATNNPTSYSAMNLPDGLLIDGTTGLISGTPTTAQTKSVTIKMGNASGSSSAVLTVTVGAAPKPAITSILSAYGSVGSAFSYSIAATNNATSYSATGLTSTGLSLDSTTGIISGTPTTSGTFSVSMNATNGIGTGASVTLSIHILVSTPVLSKEYNVLHRFGSGTPAVDGEYPTTILQGFDGNYYGVTQNGGIMGTGAVYKMTEQGVVSLLYSFVDTSSGISDPQSLIQAADGNFYGTTSSNHAFKLTPSGQLTLLHYFPMTASSGVLNPLIQGYDGNFYGTTGAGYGVNGAGTVFMMTPQGMVTVLYTFGADPGAPSGSLVQGTDGNFYGITIEGGAGTVFKITPQGAEKSLHTFGGTAFNLDGTAATDGYSPGAGLIEGDDGNFYGTTGDGGANGDGVVYQMTPQGTVTILHSFSASPADGEAPTTPLLQGLDGNFYGTTYLGGSAGDGTVFQITPQGAFTLLHSFGSITNDGINPNGNNLIQGTDGNFYGATINGGASVQGTIYSIDAMQSPVYAPIYVGSAYEAVAIGAPFSFTPKALFGGSGSGLLYGADLVKPANSGLMAALVSVIPRWVANDLGVTADTGTSDDNADHWVLTQGTTPSTMLPTGLSFNSTTGAITGMATSPGIFTVMMTPYNSNGPGTIMTVTFYIEVAPVIIVPTTPPSGTAGDLFSFQINTANPASSYGVTDYPGWILPDTTTTTMGIIAGTPPGAGNFAFNAVASNVFGTTSQPIALTVTDGASDAPVITSATTASGAVGASFSYQITAAPSATSFNALSLPNGLLFNATSGLIYGTPSEVGTFSIPISAINSEGSYSSILTLTIGPASAPTIASSFSVTALQGTPFSYSVPSSGVVSSYSESGTLPTGLVLNPATGVISGTTTDLGAFPVSMTVTNGTGSSTGTLNLTVATSSTFSEWENSYNITSGPAAVPQNDGVPNLLKYLCDLDPTIPVGSSGRSALPSVATVTVGGINYLTLNFREYALATGLTMNVQTSTDLQNWTTVSPPDYSQQVGTDPNTGDPIIEVGVKTNGSAKQFIRLDVPQP